MWVLQVYTQSPKIKEIMTSSHTFRIQNHDLKSEFLLFLKSVCTVCIKICALDIYNKEYVNSKSFEILLCDYN